MASFVTTRVGNKRVTTKFVGGKAVSSTTSDARTTSAKSAIASARSGGSSSSSSSNQVAKRTAELQAQGLDRADASQIAGAESRGQTLTNLRTEVARTIASKGISSSAISQSEVQRALPQSTPRGGATQILLNKAQSDFARTLSPQERINYMNQLVQRNMLTDQQRAFARTLSERERANYISQIQQRRVQPIQSGQLTADELQAQRVASRRGTPLAIQTDKRDITKAEKEAIIKESQAIRPRALAQQVISTQSPTKEFKKSVLERWANAINERQYESQRKQAERESRLLAQRVARGEAIQYLPSGVRFIGQSFNVLANIGTAIFRTGRDFTIGFGEILANAGEKALFLPVALGSNIKEDVSRGELRNITNFAKELLSREQLSVLKQIYTDPKTYLFALVGLAIGGVLSLSKASRGTITQVTNKPSPNQIKIKGIYKNKKGEYFVTTGSRSIKVPSSMNKLFAKAEKKGAPARASKTEIARLEKKALQQPLTKAENLKLQASRTARTEKQLQSQASKIIREANARTGIKPTRIEFTRLRDLYVRYFKNPTEANIRALRRYAEKIEVNTGVRSIDARIRRSMTKKKAPEKKKPTTRMKRDISKVEVKIKDLNKQVSEALKGLKPTRQERAEFTKFFREYILRPSNRIAKKIKDLAEKIEVNSAVKNLDVIMSRRIQRRDYNPKRIFQQAIKDLESGKFRVKNLPIKKTKAERNRTIQKGERKIRARISEKLPKKATIGIQKEIGVKNPTRASPQNQRLVAETINKPKSAKARIKRKAKTLKQQSVRLSQSKIISRSAFISGAPASRINKEIQTNALLFNLLPAQLQDNSILKDLKDAQKNIKDIKKTQKQAQAQKKAIVTRSVQRAVQKPKTKKRVVAIRRVAKKKKPIKDIELPKKELSFDKEPPKGFNYLVNAIVRVRGRNRVVPLRTTKNRALKKIQELVDNTTARSFQLKIVGLTRRKDIRKPSEKKFRKKISRGSPVLRVVEKSKYAIDTKGEKKGLTMARLLRRKKISTRNPKKR